MAILTCTPNFEVEKEKDDEWLLGDLLLDANLRKMSNAEGNIKLLKDAISAFASVGVDVRIAFQFNMNRASNHLPLIPE